MSTTPGVVPFVHLHCHSHFSLLDGASTIEGMVAKAKSNGMNALALTDHGNLYGAIDFYRAAKDAGINPILGYEAYVAPNTRFHKEAGGMKEAAYHLTLLAQNRVGFHNLIKLASHAFLEGFYYKPRIDRELLEKYSEGIICLSGCVSGEFSSALCKGEDPDEAKAMEVAQWFHGVFKDRYFIEIQNNGLQIQQDAMAGAIRVANKMGLPLVATSDAHYVNKEDSETQDILLCINTGKLRADSKRMRMEGNEFYLRSGAEMLPFFKGHEEAIKQSQLIADTVDIQLEFGKWRFPRFDAPDQKDNKDYLRELCVNGLKERYEDDPRRYKDGQLSQEVLDRLDRELGVINKLGFANYFLIVWDFVNFAKSRGIETTARGSGVGAIVAYSLYLSHVCPLQYDLLFERFLDESRKEPPDIDIDFDKERRGEVIEYVKQKYGSANVAQIGTFGTLAARAAIRDVGRAINLPLRRVDEIVAMVPEELGISLDEALEKSDDLKKTYEGDPEVRELLDFARKIEGLARNVGTHAAAVVIADKALDEVVPLQRVTGKEEVITQWAMADVERVGLLKMDFLGLRNLTLLSQAVRLIKENNKADPAFAKFNPYKFPLDDKETFALLRRGETKGVFQLESGGIRDLLTRMKPDSFRDIIATNALYRPGPLEGGMVDEYIEVKHRRKAAAYLHPVMKDVLEETNGVMVYQEQVMRILNRLGDIPLPNSYTCIKAISKKKLELIAKYQDQFIKGATEKGVKKSDAEELFEMIKKFAGYGFNKSHSTAYALIAYMTAYLKAHFPVEFMAALLTSDQEGRNFKRKDPLVEHIEDCKRMNLTVIPPDVNQSEFSFTTKDGQIVFALGAIKGCGEAAAYAISSERKKNGPFKDLFDFCERVDMTQVSRSTLENLVKAGAFDSLGAARHRLFAGIEKAMQSGSAAQGDRKTGQKNLFAGFDDEPAPTAVAATAAATALLPDAPPWPEKERLTNEKEVLGYYLTSHPLAEHEASFKSYCSHTSPELLKLKHKDPVLLGGMLASIKVAHSKKAKPGAPSKYAMFDLEDMDGMIRCIVWPEQYAQFGQFVQADAILALRGVVDRRPGSEEVNMIVDEVIPLDELEKRYTDRVVIRLIEGEHTPKNVEQLYEILRGYPGNLELQMVLVLADGTKAHMACDKVKVSLDKEMRLQVDELLGVGNMRLVGSSKKALAAARAARRQMNNAGGPGRN